MTEVMNASMLAAICIINEASCVEDNSSNKLVMNTTSSTSSMAANKLYTLYHPVRVCTPRGGTDIFTPPVQKTIDVFTM